MWELRYQRDGFSVEAGLKKRRKFPEDHWYFQMPAIPRGSEFIFEAYSDLVTCRTPDGPIPWDKVALYADKKGLQPDTADLLWEAVKRMDRVERSWVMDNRPEGGSGA